MINSPSCDWLAFYQVQIKKKKLKFYFCKFSRMMAWRIGDRVSCMLCSISEFEKTKKICFCKNFANDGAIGFIYGLRYFLAAKYYIAKFSYNRSRARHSSHIKSRKHMTLVHGRSPRAVFNHAHFKLSSFYCQTSYPCQYLWTYVENYGLINKITKMTKFLGFHEKIHNSVVYPWIFVTSGSFSLSKFQLWIEDPKLDLSNR